MFGSPNWIVQFVKNGQFRSIAHDEVPGRESPLDGKLLKLEINLDGTIDLGKRALPVECVVGALWKL